MESLSNEPLCRHCSLAPTVENQLLALILHGKGPKFSWHDLAENAGCQQTGGLAGPNQTSLHCSAKCRTAYNLDNSRIPPVYPADC